MKKQIDPRMHSAEHLLNQTMVQMFGCDRCFSAHIEKKKSKCDYYFSRSLSEIEIKLIEKQVNRIISLNLPISEKLIPIQDARNRFNLDRLPADAGDTIRIVSIGEYDHCPCIGPHVNSTEAIGSFRITTHSFAKGVLRIRFRLKQVD